MTKNEKEADVIIDSATRLARTTGVPAGPPSAIIDQVRRAGAVATGRGTRFLKFAGLAASVLLALSAIIFFAQHWATASLAFGDVVQRLQHVQTVQYQTRTTTTTDGAVPETWTRDIVQMNGECARSETMTSRQDGTGDASARRVSIYNKGQILTLDPKNKTAIFANYNTGPAKGPHRLDNRYSLIDLVQINPADAKNLGERNFGGRKLIGFHVNRDYDENNRRSVDVWVDPGTRLPVRVEEVARMKYPGPADISRLEELNRQNGGRKPSTQEFDQLQRSWPVQTTTRILTDIVFDLPVDAETFSVKPPEGYKLSVMKIGQSLPAPAVKLHPTTSASSPKPQ